MQSAVGRRNAVTLCAQVLSDRGAETVLLVEDEDSVRRLAVQVLKTKGYEVLAAANGLDALDLCRRHGGEISLLITDVVMPGLYGPELAARLANSRPRMQVLYMSGYGGDEVADHGITDSAVSFISKPFTPRTLAAKVREALDAECS